MLVEMQRAAAPAPVLIGQSTATIAGVGSASPTPVVGTTITFVRPGLYKIDATVDSQVGVVSAGNTLVGTLLVGGGTVQIVGAVGVQNQILCQMDTLGRWTVGTTWVVRAPVGGTVQLTVQKSGAGGTVQLQHTILTATRTGAA
jgi:hypothetical protein